MAKKSVRVPEYSESDIVAAAEAEELPAEEVEDRRPKFYQRVDLDAELSPDAFLPVEKTGGMYAARLATPLLVQTPPVTLASPQLVDGHLVLPAPVAAFARDVEARVLSACLANKEQWFRRPMTDDALKASFKEFSKPTGHLKIKVPRDVLVFDADGGCLDPASVSQGDSVRCLLQLSKVCFGRTEFGAMWTLLQAKTVPAPPPPPKCMIDPTLEGCGGGGTPPEDDMHEFL